MNAKRRLIRVSASGIPNFADKNNKTSCAIAAKILDQLGSDFTKGRLDANTIGKEFEELISQFLSTTFASLKALRPCHWSISRKEKIFKYEQYAHLDEIKNLARGQLELKSVLPTDYIIKPDIVIARSCETDESINRDGPIVDADSGLKAYIRESSGSEPFLHASVSCKYSIRSDRSQGSRTEALNLLRNRKGRAPHIVAVTAEPTPNRIASVALGTGDLDCVYHFALYELEKAAAEIKNDDALELLRIMTEGKRLKDISDLPLDLAV